MTDIDDVKNSFIKAEPVMAAHLAAAVVGFVVTLLVTRGVITSTQASVVTQEVEPIAVAAAFALLGLIVRNFVTPAATLAEKIEAGIEAKLNPPTGPKHALLPAPTGDPVSTIPPVTIPVIQPAEVILAKSAAISPV